MKKYKCDICGRPLKKKIRMHGYTLCSKHMHQLLNYGEFKDNNPRTINDLNEFRPFGKDAIEFDCYDVNQNVVAHFLIDQVDLERVRYHKWRRDTNNRIITGNCTNTRPRKELSRLIMDVDDPSKVVDHIDGNPYNNQRSNLRVCTQSENLRNRHFMSNNTSGFLGVVWDKARGRWAPEIRVQNKRVHLGRFINKDEAIFARVVAEKICFKEFQTIENQNLTFESIPQNRRNEIEQYVIDKLKTKNLGN